MSTHCSVSRCDTKQPHTDDPIVQVLMHLTPEELTDLVRAGMAELLESFKSDARNNRTFAWMTRLRQADELYMRTVYVLLLAADEEIPRVLSGETPNGFDFIYAAVNKAVLDGRGELKETKPGLKFGSFTPMKTIHGATHVSFQTLLNWKTSREQPTDAVQAFPPKYVEHVEKYRQYLEQVGRMLGKGVDKSTVRQVRRNMLTPIE